MARRTRIELEAVKHITPREELALGRAAFARNPSAMNRARLATLLMHNDDIDGVIETLALAPDLTVQEDNLLSMAWLARESPEGDRAAHDAAERVLARLTGREERAAGLAIRAKAEIRLGDIDAARATLAEALALDPHNTDACKRLVALELAENDTDSVLAMYDDLTARGAAHCRLFAAKALAHARRGEDDQARAMMGTAEFFRARKLAPPPGWDTIEAFDAALAEQLLAHPGLQFERYGAASELTWRIDSPLSRSAPLVRVLLDAIVAAIGEHVGGFADSDHPWAASQPSDAILRAWCVITDSDGFENWHVHQFGWLSGAYYVRVPDSIANGDTNGGCIALGLPEDLAGDDAAMRYGQQVVRPQDGLLLLFPSHTYHRTFPHGLRDRRICVAFDVKPYIAATDESLAAA